MNVAPVRAVFRRLVSLLNKEGPGALASLASGMFLAAMLNGETFRTPAAELSELQKGLILAGIIAAGSAAAWLENRNLLDYALNEVSFGAAVGWLTVWQRMGNDNLSNMTGVVAAAFLISRGLSNLHESYKRERAKQDGAPSLAPARR